MKQAASTKSSYYDCSMTAVALSGSPADCCCSRSCLLCSTQDAAGIWLYLDWLSWSFQQRYSDLWAVYLHHLYHVTMLGSCYSRCRCHQTKGSYSSCHIHWKTIEFIQLYPISISSKSANPHLLCSLNYAFCSERHGCRRSLSFIPTALICY